MNTQEVFDKAYLGLKSQGFRKSANHNNKCFYRGPAGLKCAIGHCIPDKAYCVDWDSKNGTLASDIQAELKEMDYDLFSEVSGDFLDNLQAVHDNSNSPEDMKRRLQDFAKTCGLTVPK